AIALGTQHLLVRVEVVHARDRLFLLGADGAFLGHEALLEELGPEGQGLLGRGLVEQDLDRVLAVDRASSLPDGLNEVAPVGRAPTGREEILRLYLRPEIEDILPRHRRRIRTIPKLAEQRHVYQMRAPEHKSRREDLLTLPDNAELGYLLGDVGP